MPKVSHPAPENMGHRPWLFEVEQLADGTGVQITNTLTGEAAVTYRFDSMPLDREATLNYVEVECEMMNDRLGMQVEDKVLQSHLMKNVGSRYF